MCRSHVWSATLVTAMQMLLYCASVNTHFSYAYCGSQFFDSSRFWYSMCVSQSLSEFSLSSEYYIKDMYLGVFMCRDARHMSCFNYYEILGQRYLIYTFYIKYIFFYLYLWTIQNVFINFFHYFVYQYLS